MWQAGKFAAQAMRVPGKSILKCAFVRIGLVMLLFFIMALTGKASAQSASEPVSRLGQDSTISTRNTDTLRLMSRDSTAIDSTRRTALEDSLGIRISKDALPA